ncbi:hypothetical protein GJ496_011234 [Pomphorhynchus laevis]|nr:hypothetical protein GJ496_011234 [Pomphorhynchus laevis]
MCAGSGDPEAHGNCPSQHKADPPSYTVNCLMVVGTVYGYQQGCYALQNNGRRGGLPLMMMIRSCIFVGSRAPRTPNDWYADASLRLVSIQSRPQIRGCSVERAATLSVISFLLDCMNQAYISTLRISISYFGKSIKENRPSLYFAINPFVVEWFRDDRSAENLDTLGCH